MKYGMSYPGNPTSPMQEYKLHDLLYQQYCINKLWYAKASLAELS